MKNKKIKLSIVIPAYNEKKSILAVLKKVKSLKFDSNIEKEIIVIDDCSKDGTREILKKNGLKYADKVLYHEVNQGKGAALSTGFKEVTGDIVIVQDVDFEYDPDEIYSVIKPILNKEADVVYGSRFLKKKYKGYKSNQLANRFLTFLSNVMTGMKVTDMETCYKAFPAKFIKNIEIEEKRFGFEPEITAKIAKEKLKLKEVPISYHPRTKEEGKKINIKDGFRAIYCILKYNFSEEFRKFISYFCVGGMAAIVEWISFYISNIYLNYVISTTIAFFIATTANYFLGKLLTFRDYKKSKKDVILVFLVSGIGLLFNILLMYLFIEVIKMKIALLAKIICTGIVFMWNYISRRLFVYKEKMNK